MGAHNAGTDNAGPWLLRCPRAADVPLHESRNRELCLLWPPCVADADITRIFLPCDFHLLFFLALPQRLEIGCLPYFHTWCGLSANLECTSELCCTRLAENTGRKWHHRTTLSDCIFAAKACIDNRKKTVKHQNLLHTSLQYGEVRPTSG